MANEPHILVRSFERLILFPVDMCVLVGGIIFLFHREWMWGLFLLLMSLLLGMVGHALPHRKKQTAKQMASSGMGQRFGDITREESIGLGKAVIQATILVSVIIGASALHRHLPWYWVLVYIVISWFTFPLATVAFCFAWAWMFEKIYGPKKIS